MTTNVTFIGDPSDHWCFLGIERFEKARAEFPDEVLSLSTAPFFVARDLPSNGLPFDQYVLARFGDQAKVATELKPLIEGCTADDIPLALDAIKIMPNTLNAQRLLGWAGELGLDYPLFLALTRAHFANGVNIGDHSVLRAQAEAIGMDSEAIGALLHGHRDARKIEEHVAACIKKGISEVPIWIIGGSYAVTGVQSISFWRNVIGEIDEKGRELASKALN